MPKTNKIEYEKRLFQVQGWIVEGIQPALIIKQIVTNGWCDTRQAERMLKQAREKWTKVPEAALEEKRKIKVAELQQLKRSLKDNWKGTPSGIMALMAVEKQIILLEGLAPALQLKVKGDRENPVQYDHKVQVEIIHTGVRIASSEEEVNV
jgi:hypothetical protein